MKNRLTSTLAFALLFLLVVATPTIAKETWTSVQSKNFFLIGNGGEKDIKAVAARLEQFREVLTHLFPGMRFSTPVPTTVVVFKSESSFRPFKGGANLAGYFQKGEDVNYIALTTDLQSTTQDAFDVIFHEYTHLLVDNTIGNAPLWFNEGLAEYYSTFTIKNDQQFALGKPIGNHVFLLRQNKLLPFRTLFDVDHKSPHYNERNKQSIFYAESWAFMHYLIIGKAGRVEQLAKFVELSNTNISKEQAFQEAFQTTFEAMEKELRDYVKKDRYNILEGHFKNKLETETDMTSTVISEAQAQAYLGDLLLHSNRKDSLSYLKKALSLDPDLGMANAAMGMALLREGKQADALQHLERAVKANSQNYLVHYYYAYALGEQYRNSSGMVANFPTELGKQIRDELLKAIKLRPDFPASYSLLGFTSLITGDNVQETKTLLTQALNKTPGRAELIFMLGQLELRSNDMKKAKALFELVLKSKAEDQTRQRAEMMLAQVDKFLEQQAQYETRRSQSSQTPGPTSPSLGNLNRTQTTSNESTPPQPADPSSYLREVLRQPVDGETQLQGTLLRIECDAKGIVFFVRSGEETLRLHTTSFEEINITSYTPSIQGDLTCGARKPDESVVVVFVKNTDKKVKAEGSIKSIEFVPANFRLK